MSGFIEDDVYPVVPEASALGNLGEDAFSFLVRRLRFGLAPNPTDDNGNTIDRFVFVTGLAEDGRLRQFGLITAQVKTGDSFFGNVTEGGWWHPMSAREATVPLGKPLGHIIVLVEPQTPIAYWAELTPQARVSTGQGFKLFIPASQTISSDCAEALRDVWRKAEMKRRGWTQSSWIAPGATPIADDGDRLVASILTPRLVAPHPNLVRPGSGPVTPEQAVALICAGRVPELQDNLERFRTPAHPAFDAMASHDDWRWRLAAALVDHPSLTDERVTALAGAATGIAGRAVAAIVHATWLARRSRLAEADEVLDRASDEATGLVAAWLLVQRARFARRLGKRDVAVGLLEAALPHVAFDDRPWATALTAAVMSAKLSAENLMGDAAARAVAANDNEQAWWAAQIRSSILEDHLSTQMSQFMPAGSVRFQFEDVAANRASGLVLAADLSGNEGRYRYELRLAGRDRAATHPNNPRELAAALDMLRLAGEQSDVVNLIRRIRELDGDAELVRRWVEIANLTQWTQPVAANVAFARGVVGLVDDNAVHEWVAQLVDQFESAGHQAPSVDVGTAISMAAAAIRVAGPDDRLALFDVAMTSAEQFLPEARVGDECVRLVAGLDSHGVALRAEAIAAAMDRAVSYRFEIAMALDEAGVEAGVAAVEELASGGDLRALTYMLEGQRDTSFVDATLVATRVQGAIAFVSNGARSFGGGASDLTLAGLWVAHTGDPVATSMLAGLLSDPEIAGDHKCDVLLGLLGVDDLPGEVIEQFHGVADAISVPHRWDPEVRQVSEIALRTSAAALGTCLDSLDVAAILGMLGSKNELDRELGARLAHRWAADRNTREVVVAVLSPLLSDLEPALRQLVARLTADLASDDAEAARVLRLMLPNLRRTEVRAMLGVLIGKERGGSAGARSLVEYMSTDVERNVDHATARLLARRLS